MKELDFCRRKGGCQGEVGIIRHLKLARYSLSKCGGIGHTTDRKISWPIQINVGGRDAVTSCW